MAVIAAVDLDDLRATRETPGDAHRGHRRLGAGRHKPQLLQRGHRQADALGEIDFTGGGRAKAGPRRRGGRDGRDDVRIGVPEDERSPGSHEVEVAIAIDILNVGARTAVQEDRRSPDGLEGPNRRVDASGEKLARPLEETLGRGTVGGYAVVGHKNIGL